MHRKFEHQGMYAEDLIIVYTNMSMRVPIITYIHTYMYIYTHRYANRAKNIKNKPKINEDPKDAHIYIHTYMYLYMHTQVCKSCQEY